MTLISNADSSIAMIDAVNLFENPYFEQNSTGAFATAGATVARTDPTNVGDLVAEGKYSLKVTTVGGTDVGVGFKKLDGTRIPVTALQFYKLYALANGPGGLQLKLRVEWYNGGGSVISTEDHNNLETLPGVFCLLGQDINFSAPSGAVTCIPYILSTGLTGSIFVDFVHFVVGAGSVSVLDIPTEGRLRQIISTYPRPGNRFRNWTPDVKKVAHRSTLLSTGQINEFKFRRDYLVSLEIPGLKTAVGAYYAVLLKDFLMQGGKVIVYSGDSQFSLYVCGLAPDTEPQLTFTDKAMLEYTFACTLRNTHDFPLLALYT